MTTVVKSQVHIGRSFTVLLGALTALTALSIDLNLPALPQLAAAFQAPVAAVQLTLSLYLLGFGAGQMVCGPLSDRVGRRPVLLAGLVVFTLAGFVCAFSPSLMVLVISRFVQGAGASAGPVLARAMVRDCCEEKQAAAVLSQMAQLMIITPLIAPLLGGYLLVWFGWPTIFTVLAGSGLLLTLVCWRTLPETLDTHSLARATNRQAEVQSGSSLWQDIKRVLSNRSTLQHMLTSCFASAGIFAYISALPFLLVDAFDAPHLNVGYVFLPTSAALMLGATLNRALLSRSAPAVPLRFGIMCVLLGGLTLLLLASLHIGGLASIIGPTMLYMVGIGLVQPNAMAAALAPHGQLAGLASSLIGTIQKAGGALAGYCVGAFYNGTSVPLAAIMALFAVLAFLAYDCIEIIPKPSLTK